MNRVLDAILNHKWAVILAIVVSLFVAFPQVYFRIEHRNDGIYQGIELLPDSPWSARVREIQDGNGFGSIYYKEGKDNPYLFQPLGSGLVAYMGKIFSLEINNTILLSRFVLPFFAYLLFYIFVYLYSRDKLVALCAASVILLADSILNVSGIPRILEGISPSSFLELARPVNSAMIFIPLFGFLVFFWQFYNKQTLNNAILPAIFLALNFYNYFYTWTYLYAFGAILVLILLVLRNWREALSIAGVFAGALLLAVPYVFNLYRATMHPAYEEVSLRFGFVLTHAPLFIGFSAIIALVIFIVGFPRDDQKKYIFGLALLLAPILTMNQQLLTGKIIQAGHYHWYFHKPMAVIFVLAVLFYWLTRLNLHSYKRILATIIVSVSFATGFFIQAASYVNDFVTRDGGYIAIERQKYGPVMEWLSENAEDGQVVFANDETSHMTVIYTPLDVFYHRSAIYTLSAARERLLDTLFTFYRLRGISNEEAREVFFSERGFVSANIYGMHYKEAVGSYEDIPDEELEDIIELYIKTLNTPTPEWLNEVWQKYEVEYIVWDKLKDPLWQLDKYSFLKKEVTLGDLTVYSIKPKR